MGEDPVTLDEAAARGALACAQCGRPGASLREIGGQRRPVCARCAAKGRVAPWILAALVAAAIGLAALLAARRAPTGPALPPGADAQPEAWVKETSDLMKMGKYREARDRIRQLLEPLPKHPLLNFMLGECLFRLRDYAGALPAYQAVIDGDPEGRPVATLWSGILLQELGRSAEALPRLEPPAPLPELEELRRLTLAECLVDLERYDDALKLLDPAAPDPRRDRLRRRALDGAGRPEPELHDPVARALRLREQGDFDAARRALTEVSPEGAALRLRRAEMQLAVEAGRVEDLDRAASELAASSEPQARGEGLHGRALARLLEGKPDAAKAAAWEFLAKTDPDYSPLRLERLMMRHFVGDLKDSDLDAEAKMLSRFHQNDLYAYLALATGSKSWAEKAAAATPGRNYPYHLIQRLLK